MRRKEFDTKAKVVVITGAASGIGLATARAFLEHGSRVSMLDVNGALLDAGYQELCDEFGSERVHSVRCDVSVDAELESAVQAVMQRWGSIHVLINNAAVVLGGHFSDHRPERMRAAVLVNLYAPMRLCQLVAPIMEGAGGGHIVNLFSGSAAGGVPGFSCYGATKAGLAGFTRVLRRELIESNVSLTLLCPGLTRTPSSEKAIERSSGFRPSYHEPAVAAEAIVEATQKRRRYVGVSDPPLVPTLFAFMDRFFPGLMDLFWVKFATPAHFEAISDEPADPESTC